MSSGVLHIVDSRTKQKYGIPIRRNVISAIDLKSIKAPAAGTDRADHVADGLRVHDPGLQNTTVIDDHERGVLLFRGYTLSQLWDSDFEDMLHLLVWGTYPTIQQKKDVNRKLTDQMLAVPDSVHRTIRGLPRTTSPLPLILAGLSAYLACFPDTIPASTHASLYQGNLRNVDHAVIRTVAAYGVIFGLVNSHRKGIDFQPPSQENSYCANLFIMAGLLDRHSSRPDPTKLSCFRRFAMLNAEHGMALTVFSALVTASSLTDPISCLISAVAAAYGPLHFGATVSAQRTLREIGSTDKVPEFIEGVKNGRTKLFGYGHRSYKGLDPRVRPIQSILKDLDLSKNDYLKITERIEEVASADDYFRHRGLYPNADFYGNFVFTAIGFDPDIIPAAMLTQRIIGIMAHWREYMCSFADQAGRRPAYILCFLIYIISNIALALQHSYPALLVLRAIQSSGSSGTVALASAVAADVITSAERGTYMSITSLGNILAPSLGPILGGVLSEYLGWQSIFWFLAMSSTIFFIPLVLFFPETCRTIVGDGSIPASGWNRSILNRWISKRPHRRPVLIPSASTEPALQAQLPKRRMINPLTTLSLLFHLPTGLILLSNGLIFASYYAITAGLPSQLRSIYGLNDLNIGLSFIPMGAGTLLSATFNGIIVDWNYRRMVAKNRQVIEDFEVEKARLGVGGPVALLAPILILLYALTAPATNPPPLVLTLTLIFTISFNLTAIYNILNILLVDLHYTTPATIMATNNLVRCFLGAAATALVHPCIQRWGVRATYCLVAIVVLGVVPLLWMPDMLCTMQDTGLMDMSDNTRILDKVDGYSNGGILVNKSMGAEYIAPRPPPFSHHRYVYLLFTQMGDYQFPQCYSHIFPQTAKARAGFDIQQFVDLARLGAPVAGNYFIVEYDGPVIEPTAAASPTTTWLRSILCEGSDSTGSVAAKACEMEGSLQIVM
ncbi:EcCSAthCS-perlike [Aspergillus parasiticus SU-1]|uniref:Citrate synthase n=1 Tax=Aspergillus parasiticus (strain ATCC 56775 / NRRL 5862 / SRRC 143 / SU-1) TaxID=1403190 RepID=A0A0F0IGU3_ASPPU|nr:EcCSAthCS-perlike [Aspergillus parasiticus SU-1]